MPATFVDTSMWLALADARDANHARARDWLESFTGRLVTSSDVLDETVTVVLDRCGHAQACAVGAMLQRPDEVDLVHVDETMREAALALFAERPDKRYSLTDCTSFVVMRNLGLREAATFDADFAREGFHVVP